MSFRFRMNKIQLFEVTTLVLQSEDLAAKGAHPEGSAGSAMDRDPGVFSDVKFYIARRSSYHP
jgi:hypothetical protein